MTKTIFLTVLSFLISAPLFAQTNDNERKFEQPYWIEQPVIEALGRARVELPPNRARFSVRFSETDRDAKVAMQTAVERARAAYTAIKAVSGEASEVATSVTVNPYFEQYRDRDGDRIENRRADKVRGYEANVTVRVLVNDVAVAGPARAAALALGPEEAEPLQVYLDQTANVLQQAYAAAVADAAARAEASASAAGAALGKLLVIQEGSSPCMGRWTGGTGRMAMNQFRASPPGDRLETVSVTASAKHSFTGADDAVTQAEINALNLPSDPPKQTVEAQVCVVYAVGD